MLTWLKWKLGIGWKHYQTIRETKECQGKTLVMLTDCWHCQKTGELRLVTTSHFSLPSAAEVAAALQGETAR